MQLEAAKLPLKKSQSQWLSTLIAGFQNERNNWAMQTNNEFKDYLGSCARLRLPLLRLVAGAYLHISYDLARVVADNWPGRPRSPEPSEVEGEELYFDLATVFPQVAHRRGPQSEGRRRLGLARHSSNDFADLDHAWVGAAAVSVVVGVAGGMLWRIRRDTTAFVDDFGQRVADYTTAAAFKTPEGFHDYLRRRASRDRIHVESEPPARARRLASACRQQSSTAAAGTFRIPGTGELWNDP
jgi:hypothetical protein